MQRLNWSDMSVKDKIKHIVECVLHYTWFDSDESYYEERRAKGGVKLPICICGYLYMFESGDDGKLYDGKLFNPIVDLNDAWKLLELSRFCYAEVTYNSEHVYYNANKMYKYCCRVYKVDMTPDSKTICFGDTPQDAICRAVITACGVVLD